MELGPYFRRLRRERGLTLIDVAAWAGLSVTTIQNLEKGRGYATWSTITKTLEAMGLEPVFDVKEIKLDE